MDDDDDDASTIVAHDSDDDGRRATPRAIDITEDNDDARARTADDARRDEDLKHDLERSSARCVRHILDAARRRYEGSPITTRCATRLRDIQTASDACAMMIEREYGEMAHTRTVEGRRKMEDAMEQRTVMVENLVRTQLMNEFSCVTMALAVTYLDYFIAMSGYTIGSNSSWLYQLVACACMLIAVKFEEPAQNVRRDISSRLQSTSDISFDHVAVRKMEAIVLRELNWCVSRVTPFQYVPYFLILVDGQSFIRGHNDRTTMVLQRAEMLSLMVLYNANILTECQSSVIAKAILCIVLAEQCGHVYEAGCIARTIVTHILHHLYEHDAEHFELINAQVWKCMCMMNDFMNKMNSIAHRAHECSDTTPSQMTGNQAQLHAVTAE